jgi:hypothetical protein
MTNNAAMGEKTPQVPAKYFCSERLYSPFLTRAYTYQYSTKLKMANKVALGEKTPQDYIQ